MFFFYYNFIFIFFFFYKNVACRPRIYTTFPTNVKGQSRMFATLREHSFVRRWGVKWNFTWLDNEGRKNGRCTFWRSCTKCTMEWVFLARAVFLLSFICFFHCVMRRTRRSFHPTTDPAILLPLEFLIRAVSFDGSRAARSYDSPIRRIASVATILISFPAESSGASLSYCVTYVLHDTTW